MSLFTNIQDSMFTRARNNSSTTHPDNSLNTASTLSTQSNCFICSKLQCALTTHRLAALSLQRRVTNTKYSHLLKANILSRESSKLDPKPEAPAKRPEEERPPNSSVSRAVTSFTPFPVPGASRHVISQFYDFFGHQGSTIYDRNRTLTFDSGNYVHLVPKALKNAALCMSCVAMSATYQVVHGRNLPSSTVNNLVVYNQTFQLLGKQIESEASNALSEATIQTCLNLIMSCGLGLGDPAAAVLHWKGCLALFHRTNVSLYSGHMLMLVAMMDFWLSICAGCKPRAEVEWMSPVVFPAFTSLKYGAAFSIIFAHLMLSDEIVGRLHETCLITCAVTQDLEEHVLKHENNPAVPLGTYFEYLRFVLMTQNTILCSELEGLNSLEECLGLTLCLFFVIVMRRTPWKYPILYLCSRLRHCLEIVMNCNSTMRDDPKLFFRDINSVEPVLLDCYTWMVSVHAYASQMCEDETGQDWSHQAITVLLIRQDENPEQSRLQIILGILRCFCWSDMFLSHGFMMFCRKYNII